MTLIVCDELNLFRGRVGAGKPYSSGGVLLQTLLKQRTHWKGEGKGLVGFTVSFPHRMEGGSCAVSKLVPEPTGSASPSQVAG